MGRRPLTAAASQNILSHFAARDGRDRAARRKPLPRKRSALTVVGFEPRAGASITKKFSRAGASITKKVGSRWGRKAGGQTEGRWGRPLFPGWLFFFCGQTEKKLLLEISFIPRGEGFFGFFCRLRRWGGRHPAPTRVPLRVCGTQAPASEMGTGNSASHLRVCRTNLDG